MDSLAGMLAESATLQARCDPQTQAEAAKHIFQTSYIPEALEDFVFPFLLIKRGGTFGYREIGKGSGNLLRPYGSLSVLVGDEDKYPDSAADGEMDFGNFTEGVIKDVATIAGNNTNMSIVDIETEEEIGRSDIGQQTPIYVAVYRFHWEQPG